MGRKIRKQPAKAKQLRCGECDGPLDGSDLAYGLVCNACGIRVAGPFADAQDVPDYLPELVK